MAYSVGDDGADPEIYHLPSKLPPRLLRAVAGALPPSFHPLRRAVTLRAVQVDVTQGGSGRAVAEELLNLTDTRSLAARLRLHQRRRSEMPALQRSNTKYSCDLRVCIHEAAWSAARR